MRIISIGMAVSQLSEISIGMYLVNYQSDMRGRSVITVTIQPHLPLEPQDPSGSASADLQTTFTSPSTIHLLIDNQQYNHQIYQNVRIKQDQDALYFRWAYARDVRLSLSRVFLELPTVLRPRESCLKKRQSIRR